MSKFEKLKNVNPLPVAEVLALAAFDLIRQKLGLVISGDTVEARTFREITNVEKPVATEEELYG